MNICEEHDLNEFFNVGGGVVFVGCTKCPYWEPAKNEVEVTITLYDENGNIVNS